MGWEGLNRRKFPRVMFPCLVKISRQGEPPEMILTHTENVSSGGVCVIELCDGDRSRMTIRLSSEGPTLLGLAEAFWRRER